MDVTFNEEQPFYSNTSFEGGTSDASDWDTCLPIATPNTSHTDSNTTSNITNSHSQENTRQQPQQKNSEVIVYSRRPKKHQVIQSTTNLATHESEPTENSSVTA